MYSKCILTVFKLIYTPENFQGWSWANGGTLQVYAIMGRRLFDFEIRNSKFEIHNSVFPAAGVYILRLGEKTHKIVIS